MHYQAIMCLLQVTGGNLDDSSLSSEEQDSETDSEGEVHDEVTGDHVYCASSSAGKDPENSEDPSHQLLEADTKPGPLSSKPGPLSSKTGPTNSKPGPLSSKFCSKAGRKRFKFKGRVLGPGMPGPRCAKPGQARKGAKCGRAPLKKTQDQIDALKNVFAKYPRPSKERCAKLGKMIGLSEQSVHIWFQNERQKARKEKELGLTSNEKNPNSEEKNQSSEEKDPMSKEEDSSTNNKDPSSKEKDPRNKTQGANSKKDGEKSSKRGPKSGAVPEKRVVIVRNPDGTNRKHIVTQKSDTQMKILKHLFNDYNKPSMLQCNKLGRQIGLTGKVVYIWFNNKRQNKKKLKSKSLDESEDHSKSDESLQAQAPTKCELCDYKYLSSKAPIRDHTYSIRHIRAVKDSIIGPRGSAGKKSDVKNLDSKDGNETTCKEIEMTTDSSNPSNTDLVSENSVGKDGDSEICNTQQASKNNVTLGEDFEQGNLSSAATDQPLDELTGKHTGTKPLGSDDALASGLSKNVPKGAEFIWDNDKPDDMKHPSETSGDTELHVAADLKTTATSCDKVAGEAAPGDQLTNEQVYKVQVEEINVVVKNEVASTDEPSSNYGSEETSSRKRRNKGRNTKYQDYVNLELDDELFSPKPQKKENKKQSRNKPENVKSRKRSLDVSESGNSKKQLHKRSADVSESANPPKKKFRTKRPATKYNPREDVHDNLEPLPDDEPDHDAGDMEAPWNAQSDDDDLSPDHKKEKSSSHRNESHDKKESHERKESHGESEGQDVVAPENNSITEHDHMYSIPPPTKKKRERKSSKCDTFHFTSIKKEPPVPEPLVNTADIERMVSEESDPDWRPTGSKKPRNDHGKRKVSKTGKKTTERKPQRKKGKRLDPCLIGYSGDTDMNQDSGEHKDMTLENKSLPDEQDDSLEDWMMSEMTDKSDALSRSRAMLSKELSKLEDLARAQKTQDVSVPKEVSKSHEKKRGRPRRGSKLKVASAESNVQNEVEVESELGLPLFNTDHVTQSEEVSSAEEDPSASQFLSELLGALNPDSSADLDSLNLDAALDLDGLNPEVVSDAALGTGSSGPDPVEEMMAKMETNSKDKPKEMEKQLGAGFPDTLVEAKNTFAKDENVRATVKNSNLDHTKTSVEKCQPPKLTNSQLKALGGEFSKFANIPMKSEIKSHSKGENQLRSDNYMKESHRSPIDQATVSKVKSKQELPSNVQTVSGGHIRPMLQALATSTLSSQTLYSIMHDHDYTSKPDIKVHCLTDESGEQVKHRIDSKQIKVMYKKTSNPSDEAMQEDGEDRKGGHVFPGLSEMDTSMLESQDQDVKDIVGLVKSESKLSKTQPQVETISAPSAIQDFSQSGSVSYSGPSIHSAGSEKSNVESQLDLSTQCIATDRLGIPSNQRVLMSSGSDPSTPSVSLESTECSSNSAYKQSEVGIRKTSKAQRESDGASKQGKFVSLLTGHRVDAPQPGSSAVPNTGSISSVFDQNVKVLSPSAEVVTKKLSSSVPSSTATVAGGIVLDNASTVSAASEQGAYASVCEDNAPSVTPSSQTIITIIAPPTPNISKPESSNLLAANPTQDTTPSAHNPRASTSSQGNTHSDTSTAPHSTSVGGEVEMKTVDPTRSYNVEKLKEKLKKQEEELARMEREKQRTETMINLWSSDQ